MRRIISIFAILVVMSMSGAGMFAGGTAHAETRGCGSEQYIAWYNSRPPREVHVHDGVTHYYDDEAFAAWWDARYCG